MENLTSLADVTAKRERECQEYDNFTSGIEEVLMCPKEFDGWTCINATPAGSVAQFPCPYFVVGFDPQRLGHRVCLEDGTWFKHPDNNKTWSNYTTCIDLEDLEMRKQVNLIYKIGYAISLAALLLSIFIFCYFRSLSCTRIQIHKNLFISLALNNLLWLVWYEAVVDDHVTLIDNGVWCRLLYVLVQYFMVATYFWMFCEGLYLHTLLVVTFLTESKVMPVLYNIGWGVPALLVTIYAALRLTSASEDVHCWIHESYYSLTLSAPVCISMVANFVFLINIVRLLLTKLHPGQTTSPPARPATLPPPTNNVNFRSNRRSTSVSVGGAPSGRTRKAVRATLILIPLLGMQYLVMPFRPEEGTTWETAYQMISAIVASCQGLCVACLFCFFNGEVVSAVRKKWRQCRLYKRRTWNSCSGMTSVSKLKEAKKALVEKSSLSP